MASEGRGKLCGLGVSWEPAGMASPRAEQAKNKARTIARRRRNPTFSIPPPQKTHPESLHFLYQVQTNLPAAPGGRTSRCAMGQKWPCDTTAYGLHLWSSLASKLLRKCMADRGRASCRYWRWQGPQVLVFVSRLDLNSKQEHATACR